jgi:heterodisulfide reductase subunit A-like polyferredoxin
MPQLPVARRLDNFVEVEGGYDDESAQKEAARCLACGVCSECMSCTFACGVDAIDHNMLVREEVVKAGAVILAPGYQVYRAELSEEYGFGRYPNVITSLQYERILSASGPTRGHLKRPSDGKAPKRIAFLQCVGSRDQSHDYCSSVCCMYAAKEAIMTIEHARAQARTTGEDPEVSCEVFFMDTRAFSKGYEEYYRRAEEKYGVKYTRARISQLREDPQTGNLVLRYATPYSGQYKPIESEFDLVVLSVGMEISEPVRELGRNLGIELDSYGFCHTTLFDPLQTSREGIFAAGPFREPKDIPETVMEASGAAAAAAQLLANSRFTLTITPEYPPERDVSEEPARTGVFVCHCGSNIGGYLDVPAVAEYANRLPGVVHSEENLYTCSQNTVSHIMEQVKELGLNRVVVASCTPLTHEGLFQDAIRQAGLNPHLFEMANIRNQCSWVHSRDWESATQKAKSLVRMAVARASRLQPLETTQVSVSNVALVVGGGAAGMNTAINLAEQGFPAHIVEREDELGGNLRRLRYFLPTGVQLSPQEYLDELLGRINAHPLVQIHTNSQLLETKGFKGNFVSKLQGPQGNFKINHGVTIIATGGVEYKGPEYAYGKDERILTQLEFEDRLLRLDSTPASKEGVPGSVVMIQCVGPAEQYCSRICCTTALKNALHLKEQYPETDVTIFYHDIRTYGFKENLYTEARRKGVRFVHYDFERRPEVIPGDVHSGKPVMVKAFESTLGRELTLTPDLVVLSMPVVPPEGSRELASRLKLSTGPDGFFLEVHVKLRPVDFASDGAYMAGMAHYPKLLDESIAQAQAAASRASIILAQNSMVTNARVAMVDPQKCVGCLTCVRICPYDVPVVRMDLTGVGGVNGAAYIEPAACHGCGSCASECPAQAIQLMHSTDAQTLIKIQALFSEVDDGIKL